LQASQFQIPLKLYGIIHDQYLWNAEGEIFMLSLKKRLNMIFGENSIEQALHDEAIGWRIETDKNAKRVSRVFIADGRQCWPSNREAINGIDDEKIKLREIKFGALVGTCWLGPSSD
jgi:hypothetical protein